MILNNRQQEIVDSTEENILVEAGPGTGKTATLIAAAEKYMKNNPDSKVVLLTFTVAAAEEMEKRLDADPHFIGTIHGFALKQLAILAAKHKFRLRILTANQMQNIFYNILKKGKKEEYVDELYSFFTNRRETEVWKEHSKKRKIFEDALDEYNQFKLKNSLYDFTDTPSYLVKKLNECGEVLKFDKVYVDETQDLSEDQFDLIQKIESDKFFIGDPNQSIYGFRGASVAIFRRIEFECVTRTLEISYRCYQEVLDYVESYLKSSKGYGNNIISEKAFTEDCVFLCRTNREAFGLRENGFNAMTIHQAKGLEFENVIVVDFSIDEEEDKNLFYVACTRTKNRLLVIGKTELTKLIQKLDKKKKM